PTEEVVAQGLEAAKPFIRALCDAQAELAASSARPTAEFPLFPDFGDDVSEAVEQQVSGPLAEAIAIGGKQERETRLEEIRAEMTQALGERFAGREGELSAAYRAVTKQAIRRRVLTEGVRIDGRGLKDIRTLSAEVEVLPRVHGSALFERGETQIMGVTTLNMLRMEQQLDTLSPVTRKRYMHNYNFP
ncbi:polyribonucleotide nucleotidyltransferase, partial [Georgenia sp. 10Sc9-8]|nr:polyribonucleotide nucleotidyltransferase [Georgenia halotolerans]